MKRNKLQGGVYLFVLAVLVIIMGVSTLANAQPNGADNVNVVSSERRLTTSPQTTDAEAGNVTELKIDGTAITQHWTGFYGNVSGTITLDDAENNTMYDWQLASPRGEVYAVDSGTVSWSSLICANITHVTTEQQDYSISADNVDNITETFSQTTHPAFYVGTLSFSADECNYSLSTYVDDAADSARTFNETLLYDDTNHNIVYTALLGNDNNGFKTGTADKYDFQMLVPENGTHADTATTPYYFFVELE